MLPDKRYLLFCIIAFILTLLAFATGTQLFIGENARVMPVFPDGSQAVASHGFDIHQRSLFDTQAGLILQHAGLAAFARAPRARTGPSQRFPAMYAFVIVAPDQGKLSFFVVQHE